jgi:hypothetical protein
MVPDDVDVGVACRVLRLGGEMSNGPWQPLDGRKPYRSQLRSAQNHYRRVV